MSQSRPLLCVRRDPTSAGLRVTPGDGHMSFALKRLLITSMATQRSFRTTRRLKARCNEASYAAEFVAEASIADERETTAELVEFAAITRNY